MEIRGNKAEGLLRIRAGRGYGGFERRPKPPAGSRDRGTARIRALKVMARTGVDFDDVFLALLAREHGGAVVSFDRDFK